MKLSFSSFLPEDFVAAMRDISWSILGDEELLLFLVFLALPGVIIIGIIALRVRRNYNRVRYAEGAVRRREEYHSSSDSSSSDETDTDDERDFMSLDEMLAATYGIASAPSTRRAMATLTSEEPEPLSNDVGNQEINTREDPRSEAKKKN